MGAHRQRMADRVRGVSR